MTNNLLVVDDDRRLRDLLAKFLQENGFQVQTASCAAEARTHLAARTFDLIILDIMMPGETGLELTKSLRQSLSIPVLLLSARGEVDDKVEGLTVGAEDYLTKPFEPKELLARIRVILRRTSSSITVQNDKIKLGDYEFDREQGTLTQEGNPIFLTSTELILLKVLAQNPRQPFSREDLSQKIGYRVSDRTIDVQITRLRRKLGDDPRQPRYIQTVRHIGYVLCPDE